MEKFKIGDVVILKSGSKRMTINEINDNIAKCVWFDEKQEIKNANFDVELLEKPSGPRISII